MSFRASTGLNTVYLTLSLLGSLKVWRGGERRGGEGRIWREGEGGERGEGREGRGGEGRIWREGEGLVASEISNLV